MKTQTFQRKITVICAVLTLIALLMCQSALAQTPTPTAEPTPNDAAQTMAVLVGMVALFGGIITASEISNKKSSSMTNIYLIVGYVVAIILTTVIGSIITGVI